MDRAERAKETMARLGVGKGDLAAAFPEFDEVKNRFTYGEARRQGSLDERTRALVVIDCLAVLEADALGGQIEAALEVGVSPVEVQEVFHQIAPYVGFPRAERGLAVLARVLGEKNVALPLESQSAVDEDTRLERGIEAQGAIFGAEAIASMRAGAPEEQRWMQDFLSAFCFGDTYTRGGLDLKTRELLTFVAIVTLGGADPQARAHAAGNLAVGNDAEKLFSAIATLVPYLGFPRSLNAMAAVNDAAKAAAKAQ
jgi:4-carboxymuconolactone decarboxylase